MDSVKATLGCSSAEATTAHNLPADGQFSGSILSTERILATDFGEI
jgi:hypothetical protein